MNADPTIRTSAIVDVSFGDGVTVVQPVNLFGCEIGDESFIGPFVEIQTGVRIGKRVRVQSHTFICEMVTIGDDTFVGHGVMFINDRFSSDGPARGNRDLYGETTIGHSVSIGSNATLLPVTVASGCVIGAGAVVTTDLTSPGVYAGNPARLIRELA